MYVNLAPPHASATLIHGGKGAAVGVTLGVPRWMVSQGIGIEVVQDFVRQPSDATRMQPAVRVEALATAWTNME